MSSETSDKLDFVAGMLVIVGAITVVHGAFKVGRLVARSLKGK